MLKAQKMKWVQKYLSASDTSTFFPTHLSSLLSPMGDTLIYHCDYQTGLLQHTLPEFYEEILSFLSELFKLDTKC